VLRTRYRSDAFQRCYFVIESLESLLEALESSELESLYRELDSEVEVEP
jgi:phenylalanine-4-hydroxylase